MAKQYALSTDQKRQFIAYQLELINQRNKVIDKYATPTDIGHQFDVEAARNRQSAINSGTGKSGTGDDSWLNTGTVKHSDLNTTYVLPGAAGRLGKIINQGN